MNPWVRRLLPWLIVVLVAFAGGFFAGRKGPALAQSIDKTHEVKSSQIQQTEEVKASTKLDEKTTTAKRKKITATTDTTRTPDGTVTIHRTVVVADATDSNTTTSETKRRDSDATTDETQHSTLDKLTVKTYQRDWRATVLVGGQLQNPLHGGLFGQNLLLMAHAERRLNFIPLIGDRLWVGVFVGGTLPVNAALEDVRTRGALYAGLSLGIEF